MSIPLRTLTIVVEPQRVLIVIPGVLRERCIELSQEEAYEMAKALRVCADSLNHYRPQ